MRKIILIAAVCCVGTSCKKGYNIKYKRLKDNTTSSGTVKPIYRIGDTIRVWDSWTDESAIITEILDSNEYYSAI